MPQLDLWGVVEEERVVIPHECRGVAVQRALEGVGILSLGSPAGARHGSCGSGVSARTPGPK